MKVKLRVLVNCSTVARTQPLNVDQICLSNVAACQDLSDVSGTLSLIRETNYGCNVNVMQMLCKYNANGIACSIAPGATSQKSYNSQEHIP